MKIKCGILEGSTSHLHINICQPKAPHAPDPLKLDPNLSPLGGETTSTSVSKFLSDWHYDPYPSFKRFSATADKNEFEQVVVTEIKRRGILTYGMVSEREDHS
jgi:hypothetical protein